MIIRLFLLVLIGTGALNSSFGQDRNVAAVPDLTGIWKLESEPGFRKNGFLVIAQSADQVSANESYEMRNERVSNSLKLFPDGRGERNVISYAGNVSPVAITSKTEWKKNKLVRKFSVYEEMRSSRGDRLEVRSTTTESFSVSKDGKKLTVDVSVVRDSQSVGLIESNSRRVYRREP